MVSNTSREAVVVGDDDHSRVLLVSDLREQFHDLFSALTIQRGGRLIGEKHIRVVGQRSGDCHSLLFAAG